MMVYKMTNKVNGMSYVGATIRPMNRRISDHVKAAKQGRTTLVAQAIREFGIAAFAIETLVTLQNGTYDDLMKAEIEAIRQHGTLEPSGYNRTTGGVGTPDCRMLESTKLKIGQTSKGRFPSAETRMKLSLAHKGKPCPWSQGPTGRPAWNRGIPATEETRRKLSESRSGGKNWKARPIEFQGRCYACISDAVRDTKFSMMQVSYRLQKGDGARYLTKQEYEEKLQK